MNLIEVYNFLAPKLEELGSIYIAGGAVRDYLMGKEPKDYDLFILTNNTWTNVHANITNKLIENNLKEVKSDLEFHNSEPFMLSQIELGDKRVQIMYSHKKDINELLDSFDWNVSLFAYGNEGLVQREDIKNIGMGKELYLQNITFPSSSLRRGFRFSERFGMQINKEDLYRLCWLVSKKQEKMNDDYVI